MACSLTRPADGIREVAEEGGSGKEENGGGDEGGPFDGVIAFEGFIESSGQEPDLHGEHEDEHADDTQGKRVCFRGGSLTG